MIPERRVRPGRIARCEPFPQSRSNCCRVDPLPRQISHQALQSNLHLVFHERFRDFEFVVFFQPVKQGVPHLLVGAGLFVFFEIIPDFHPEVCQASGSLQVPGQTRRRAQGAFSP